MFSSKEGCLVVYELVGKVWCLNEFVTQKFANLDIRRVSNWLVRITCFFP